VVLRVCSVVLCVRYIKDVFAVRILGNMNFTRGMKLRFEVLYICDSKC
jgi:hypothetical protein